jgi:hypothetical protein
MVDVTTPRPETVVANAADQLTALLDLRGCWFEPFPFEVQLPRIESGRIVLPAEEPGIEPWTLDRGVELPVRFRSLTLGRYVLLPRTRTAGVALSSSARAAAIALAEEIGAPIAAAMLGA